MRAVVLRDGRLEVRETTDPVPGDGELLLRTLSTAICASDVHYMDHGTPPTTPGAPRETHRDHDVVMGHEFVGVVVGHGAGCSDRFPVGTRVTAMPVLRHGGVTRVVGQHPDAPGSFGEYFLVAERFTRAVPDGVPDDSVALVDAFAVGEFYVRTAAVETATVPLVIGAGAIGLSAVVALAARGIEPIVVSDFNAERRELAQRFGAHVTVDPADESPYVVARSEAARRGWRAPMTVFECVGAPGILQQIIGESDPGSRIQCAGGWYATDSVDCAAATARGVTIQFGGGPHTVDWFATLDAVCDGRLDPRPSIGRIIGLDEVPAALEQVRRAEGPPRIVVHPYD